MLMRAYEYSTKSSSYALAISLSELALFVFVAYHAPSLFSLFIRERAMEIIHPDSRSHISSSVARLRSKGPNTMALNRIDDLYPLTDFEGKRAQNEITGPDGKPNSSANDQTTTPELETHPQSIEIKTGWEVRSDEAV